MAKRLVVPGELVTEERKKLGSHVYISEGKIYSDSIGLVDDESNFASVVPLEGKYLPQVNDLVLGVISSEKFAGYVVDINSFYPSFISKKELREMLKPGSVVSAKVLKVNELNEVDLGSIRTFFGGEILTISPVKIPRVIGRDCSMLNVLKAGTKSNLIVGKNGWIWAKGGDTDLLKKAIDKIGAEAHMSNLTQRMSDFLGVKQQKNDAEYIEETEEMDEYEGEE
ncbi:MAG: hypothetical protein COV47_02305 [Candidatus Diapherotrites archaeon CG11_big_fil_rev_8_21_14_0_20_37_9]|nr:MAG: hypothetical protein COV47_02305 [Candidatus Diapherotrites archaeon CG11_big_fil_rev_8_21_14_0_20_37_9]